MKTLTRKDFKRIHDIACNSWKSKLVELFPDFTFTDTVEVSDTVYSQMRDACTGEQHNLFDEIFGSDHAFTVGEWATPIEGAGGWGVHPEDEGKAFKVIRTGHHSVTLDANSNMNSVSGVGDILRISPKFLRPSTKEEIKAAWYADRTPLLVSDDGITWNLRLSAPDVGYCHHPKVYGRVVYWKFNQLFDGTLPPNLQ